MIDRIELLLKIREFKIIVKEEMDRLQNMNFDYFNSLPSENFFEKYTEFFSTELIQEAENFKDEITIDTQTAKAFFEMANEDKYDDELIEHTINDIKEFENKAYEDNKAENISRSSTLIKNRKMSSLSIEDKEWSKDDNIKFLRLFEKYPMNFEKISEELKISFSDVILHFYHVQSSKKRSLTNRERDSTFIKKILDRHGKNVEKPQVMKIEKKKGRMKNENIDKIIDETWTITDRKKFETCYQIFKENFAKYTDALPDKSEMELKLYMNFYKRKIRESQKKQEDGKLNQSKTNFIQEILNNWTLSERSIFALYYPYVGKNWNDMAIYINTKEIKDFRLYFKYYFKNLSVQEQTLESTFTENRQYNNFRMSVDVTPNGEHVYNGAEIYENDEEAVNNVGFVFQSEKK